jgi:lysophospholipase L1-like esterase
MGGVNRRTWRTAAGAALLALTLVPASARAQEPPLTLAAHRDGTGYIGLKVSGPPGATVTLTDSATGQAIAQVALTGGPQEIARAAQWRCRPRHRAFHAEGQAPSGAVITADAAITTPGCAKRFALKVRPAQPRARRPLTVLLVDRWRLGGVDFHACARGPLARKRCHTLALHEHRIRTAWRFRPGLPGNWRIQVRTANAPTRRDTAHVRPANGHLTLLATGDSMVQIIDSFLEQRLQSDHVDVSSDARISTGISKPFLLNWPLHARSQARRLRPDVTVMFIGANDGFPLHRRSGRRVSCCGPGWVLAYARRVSGMMSTYARRGAGSVYWATLPAPRAGNFRRVFRAVNAALRDAARRHPGEVHLIRLGKVFTPGFAFRQSIRWHGRVVSVRQADGVHLNVAGASIAATLIIRAMRRDGVV